MIRRWSRAVALVALTALGAAGCSVLLDWSDFTGGPGDGGTFDGSFADGGVDSGATGDGGASEAAACGAAMQCTPSAPAGWTGPVALYAAPATQGTPPSCGAGFDPTSAFDGNADLVAPPATCSACECGPVSGESCDGPVMSFFFDSSCQTAAGTQTVTSSCEPTTLGAMSVTVAAPVAAGGTCAGMGGVATTTPSTWGQRARACAATSSLPGSCPSGQVCAPAPAAPFASGMCVMQTGVATACPSGYPSGPQVFYASFDDTRGCSACDCDPPLGALCTIGAPAITNCIGGSLDAPNTCVAFTGPEPVKLAAPPTLTSPGSCSVTAGGGTPSGSATPTGATSFCCSP